MARILIVDDEPKLGKLLIELLDGQGHDLVRAAGGTEAVLRLREQPFDLVVTDLRMPGVDGMAVLREVRERTPQADVILMTAHATTENAVEAMRQGAADYLIKPFASDEFRIRIARVLERRTLSARADALARRIDREQGIGSIVVGSERMQGIMREVQRVAGTDETVLLLGESGVGKTALARAIHHSSSRAAGPLVEVHCAALPETLLESELFGHERGAFTGAVEAKGGHVEAANGGTLFLDEIGELPVATQVKLLRFLQDRTFSRLGSTQVRRGDLRIVTATNRNLAEALRKGTFREDLYYRLSVFPIAVPALRERPEDIEPLAGDILQRRGVPFERLTPAARDWLRRYHWPGNVRELENVIARALILAGADPIAPEHLPPALRGAASPLTSFDDILVGGFSLDGFERDLIHHALAKAGGNKTAAARILGITRRRLYSRLKSLEEDVRGEADED
jgi:two-component system, NtrC family, response regulator HydG